ncbi:MAG: tryptophan--tRNA ligase [Lachnospirales bacterium]
MNKKVIFSGIQPSGDLTLGNYIGAIKNWVALQDEFDCYFSIVDLHAITLKQAPKELRKRTLEILSIYVASGINPEKCTLFIQSHVKEHAELAWLLNCYTYMGELNRMTQFKDKSSKLSNQSIPVGLYDYPVLMASDILLYQTDAVPVGADQKQHVELTRDIAQRFNNEYSPTFVIPEPFIPKIGAKIMGLQNPTKKMSKSSDNDNDYILIMDTAEEIKRKVSRAITDSVGKVAYNDEQAGIKNLINILCVLTNKSSDEIVLDYAEKTYKDFKEDVANAIINELSPIRQKVLDLMETKEELEKIYALGAKKASYTANKTLNKVKRKIGFIENSRNY